MSIATLNQVFDETRRLAIAGSNLSSGDYRLQKLVEPLKEAANRAPVFGQVAAAVEKLVNAPSKESSQALLELASLVLAILYTQGQTDVEGELQPIEAVDLGIDGTQISSKQLRTLVDALTVAGSGRLEVVKEAFRRGEFRDFRIVHAAVSALVDPYADLADFVADEVLTLYGASVARLVIQQYESVERGRARCLRVLARLAPDEARPIALEALESGTKEMKVAALRCLGGSEEDVAIFHEYAKARAKAVRTAAFERLAPFGDETTIELFKSALSRRDLESVVDAAAQNRSETLATFLHGTIAQEAENILEGRTSTRSNPVAHFTVLLRALETRADDGSVDLIRKLFAERAAFQRNTSDGEIIVESLAQLMRRSSVPELQRALVDARDKMVGRAFETCVLAGLEALEPSEFYQLFGPYYKRGKKKESRCVTMLSMLRNQSDMAGHDESRPSLPREALSPQWLADAIGKNDFETVSGLAVEGNEGLHKYLSKRLGKTTRWLSVNEKTSDIIVLMLATKHPDGVDAWIAAAKAVKQDAFTKWHLLGMVRFMSAAEAHRVEEALSEYPEHMVDDVLEAIGQRKAAINP